MLRAEKGRMTNSTGNSRGRVRALVLYHIAADGTVVKAQTLDPGPLGMVHDLVVTARHPIIVIPPLVYETSHEGELLDALEWRPNLGTRVLVVDKDDFNSSSTVSPEVRRFGSNKIMTLGGD